MNKNAFLNKDQGFLLANLMKLNEEEKEFIFLLIDLDKAAIKDYQEEIKIKIKKIRNINTQSNSYLNKNESILNETEYQKYYMYTETQLVHLAFSIKEFQNNPDVLCGILNISQSLFDQIIKTLISLNLIAIKNNKVILIKSNLHLPQKSPLFHSWQMQTKIKSNEWIKKVEDKDKYNFCVSFTAEEKDKEIIYFEFMKFLKKVEAVVKNAKSKNLFQMNFDLFKWL
jgi:hypothetical protein